METYRFETPSPLVQDYSLLSYSIKHPAPPPAPAWSLLERHSPASTRHKGPQTFTCYKHTSIHLEWADPTLVKTSHNLLASSKPVALQTIPTEAWKSPPSHHPHNTNQKLQKVADASSEKQKIKKHSRLVPDGLVSLKPGAGNRN